MVATLPTRRPPRSSGIVGDAAGFTSGAIYSNFGSKQDLFLEVVACRNTRLLEDYRRMIDERPDGEAVALGDIAQVWAENELGDRDALLLTLEIRLAALRDPQVGARVGEFERRTDEAIARFVSGQLETSDGSLELPMATEQFAALVYAENQGIWQHVAICSSDHVGLFQAFLEILTRQIHAAEVDLPTSPLAAARIPEEGVADIPIGVFRPACSSLGADSLPTN